MLNYRQLHYFWVVAKTGSIVRACEQLNLTPQTISGQLSLLEQTFGIALFQRVGRQLELTEAGRQALPYAEQMFQTGNELEAMLRAQPKEQQIVFRVGVADVVPKSIVYRLIAPTMELSEPLRITCREDKLERLLADLAIQRLDLVISDSPMPTHLDIKGYSQKLGECGISFFATQALADRHTGPFPQCLHGAPLLMLLPQLHVARPEVRSAASSGWGPPCKEPRASPRPRRARCPASARGSPAAATGPVGAAAVSLPSGSPTTRSGKRFGQVSRTASRCSEFVTTKTFSTGTKPERRLTVCTSMGSSPTIGKRCFGRRKRL